jgi:acylphosphatase
MTRTTLLRLLFWAGMATISAGLTSWNSPALAADENPAPNATEKSKAPKGRLPPHYAKVVTQEQREKIYNIQEEYRTKIEAARAQLDALVKEEKDKISAVLNEEQKKKIEEFQTAAKAKKGAEKTDAQKADKTSPLVNPMEQNKKTSPLVDPLQQNKDK